MEPINITDQYGGGLYIHTNCIAKVYNLTLPEILPFLMRPIPAGAHWSLYNNTTRRFVKVEQLFKEMDEHDTLTDPVALIAASLAYFIAGRFDELAPSYAQAAAQVARWAKEVYQQYYATGTEPQHPAEDGDIERFIDHCATDYLETRFPTESES